MQFPTGVASERQKISALKILFDILNLYSLLINLISVTELYYVYHYPTPQSTPITFLTDERDHWDFIIISILHFQVAGPSGATSILPHNSLVGRLYIGIHAPEIAEPYPSWMVVHSDLT